MGGCSITSRCVAYRGSPDGRAALDAIPLHSGVGQRLARRWSRADRHHCTRTVIAAGFQIAKGPRHVTRVVKREFIPRAKLSSSFLRRPVTRIPSLFAPACDPRSPKQPKFLTRQLQPASYLVSSRLVDTLLFCSGPSPSSSPLCLSPSQPFSLSPPPPHPLAPRRRHHCHATVVPLLSQQSPAKSSPHPFLPVIGLFAPTAHVSPAERLSCPPPRCFLHHFLALPP